MAKDINICGKYLTLWREYETYMNLSWFYWQTSAATITNLVKGYDQGKPETNSAKRQNSAQVKNPWFRSMYSGKNRMMKIDY